MTDRPTCKTCRFWAREQSDDTATAEAECRAGAPVFVHGYRLAVWPTTEHSKWCGEHEPMPPPPKPWACPSAWCNEARPHHHLMRGDRRPAEIVFDDGSNAHEHTVSSSTGKAGTGLITEHCECGARRIADYRNIQGELTPPKRGAWT